MCFYGPWLLLVSGNNRPDAPGCHIGGLRMDRRDFVKTAGWGTAALLLNSRIGVGSGKSGPASAASDRSPWDPSQ